MYKTVYKEFEYITKLQRASAYCCVSVDVRHNMVSSKRKHKPQLTLRNKD